MSTSSLTYDLSLLDRSFAKWKSSLALRTVYEDIFAEMRVYLKPGSTLEIGSGIGTARDYLPGLITSDIVPTRFVDRVASAYGIPCENWNNITAVDMLHHLQEPLLFFESAAIALACGGRIILAEPAGTQWGRLFYGWFHHEPCDPDDVNPPFKFGAASDGSFANMGVAHALFGRQRACILTHLEAKGLRLVCVRYRDFMAYPATGGFSHSAFLPAFILRGILALEHCLPQRLLYFIGLRMIVVLEKIHST